MQAIRESNEHVEKAKTLLAEMKEKELDYAADIEATLALAKAIQAVALAILARGQSKGW